MTGVAANTAIGDVTLKLGATAFPAGVQATGQLNTVLVWGKIIPNQNANWTDIAA